MNTENETDECPFMGAEDPEVTYLREFEDQCLPLPEEGNWEESDSFDANCSDLFYDGVTEMGDKIITLSALCDGLTECFLCCLTADGLQAYGKGKRPSDAILAALLQIEVDLMLSNV